MLTTGGQGRLVKRTANPIGPASRPASKLQQSRQWPLVQPRRCPVCVCVAVLAAAALAPGPDQQDRAFVMLPFTAPFVRMERPLGTDKGSPVETIT